jgi:hypothetical protein
MGAGAAGSALGVSTTARAPGLPEVSAIAETLPGQEAPIGHAGGAEAVPWPRFRAGPAQQAMLPLPGNPVAMIAAHQAAWRR